MGNGRYVRAVISGFVCGLGIATLLEQFAIVPLRTVPLVAFPVGMAVVGLALGWPRGGAEPGPVPTPGRVEGVAPAGT